MFDSNMTVIDSFLILMTVVCIYSYNRELIHMLRATPDVLIGYIHTLRKDSALNQKRFAMLGALGFLVIWFAITHKGLHANSAYFVTFTMWGICIVLLYVLRRCARIYIKTGKAILSLPNFRIGVMCYVTLVIVTALILPSIYVHHLWVDH